MESRNQFLKPGLASVLRKLELDKQFTRAKGNYLYYRNNSGDEVEVIDFVGGYGSLILGHNHPQITAHAISLLQSEIPVHSQLSQKTTSVLLAEKLSNTLGSFTGEKYVCTLTNSGAETTEAAFKHARLRKTGEIKAIVNEINTRLNRIDNQALKGAITGFRSGEINNIDELKKKVTGHNSIAIKKVVPRILSGKNSFHGKTLGALKATYNKKYKDKILFESEGQDVSFFDFDIALVQKLIEDSSFSLLSPEVNDEGVVILNPVILNSCIGVIIEPIQGEGGVRTVPEEFLHSLRALTLASNIPLIFDEIQCGMYRTGYFLHSVKLNIAADYFLIGKSLGGGIAKIGALLIDQRQYDEDFCLIQSSTFAEDEFSSAIAIKALEIMEAESRRIHHISAEIRKKLDFLMEHSNGIICEVLGEGLMLGLRFTSFHDSACLPLQFISNSGYFNYFVASYLLNNFNIRVAPTLSEDYTIRIQPSLYIDQKDIDNLVSALLKLSEVLYNQDLYYFIKHFLPAEYRNLREMQRFSNGKITFTETALTKVGFLCHFIDVENAIASDQSISLLPKDILEDFLRDLIELESSLIVGSMIVEGAGPAAVEFIAIGLPFTSSMVKEATATGKLGIYRDICYKAITNLRDKHHATIVGLGQYTSILTYNGTLIPQADISITTGNSYTVYIGLQSVLSNIPPERVGKKDICIGIIGAAGNISSVFAKCFATHASRIYLKGSNSAAGYDLTVESVNSLISYIIKKLLDDDTVHESVVERRIRQTLLFSRVRSGEIDSDAGNLFEQLTLELGAHSPVIVSKSTDFLKKCELVVLATNSPDAIFSSSDFAEGAIVYDISVPQNVVKDNLMDERGIKILEGGLVKLPQNQFLPFDHFPLEKGSVFACMAETMILGLEKFEGNFSFGDITPEMVYAIGKMGDKHNFQFYKNKEVAIFK
jgi:acetylornithine/succinyldiaminopimelate/putrescine aminotransferase/predicted amino acid dehydrogenase